jgi:hypothetical protein
MNATEAYREVYEAAVKQHKRMQGLPHKRLGRALRTVILRIDKMERRLAKARAKRRTSTNRPKCLQ